MVSGVCDFQSGLAKTCEHFVITSWCSHRVTGPNGHIASGSLVLHPPRLELDARPPPPPQHNMFFFSRNRVNKRREDLKRKSAVKETCQTWSLVSRYICASIYACMHIHLYIYIDIKICFCRCGGIANVKDCSIVPD